MLNYVHIVNVQFNKLHTINIRERYLSAIEQGTYLLDKHVRNAISCCPNGVCKDQMAFKVVEFTAEKQIAFAR